MASLLSILLRLNLLLKVILEDLYSLGVRNVVIISTINIPIIDPIEERVLGAAGVTGEPGEGFGGTKRC